MTFRIKLVDRPLVSIVITCYNYGRYLRNAMASALAQTYDNIEVILVDDGSTDETPQIAASWQDDPRVTIIRQENGGQACAKNRGISEARGALIAFLDADDAWEPDKLALQVPLFTRPEVGVVGGRSRRIDEDGQFLAQHLPGGHNQARRGSVTSFLLYDNIVPFSSSVVRREALEQASGFDESLAMAIDWDLWLRISLDWEFDYVDQVVFHYRIGHADQMSRKLETRHACCDRIFNSFVQQYGDRLDRKAVRKAVAYTHRSRAAYLMRASPRRALGRYLKSLWLDPASREAYQGLLFALYAMVRRG